MKTTSPLWRRTPVVSTGLVWLLATLLAAAEAETTAQTVEGRARDRHSLAQGRFVFQKHCVPCHGRFGEGDGELVRDWEVLPRNFRQAVFKYRSTPYGKLPTEADLARTIRRGVSGTAMPSFSQLREDEIKAVIDYVRFLSPDWKDEELVAPALEVPPKPAWFDDEPIRKARAAKGRELFLNTCASCHGETGAGDGVAAASLMDSRGSSIQPADLRRPLRSGPHPEDAYRTIMTGINGTPMPGFAGALTPDEVWRLVAFVCGLQKPSNDARPPDQTTASNHSD